LGDQLRVEDPRQNNHSASAAHASSGVRGRGLHSQIAYIADGQSKVRLFQGLERAERHAILTAGSYRYFSRESVVTHQGDPADRLYLLLRGSARFFFLAPDGNKIYLHWLAPGEIFGAASLLTEAANFVVSTEVGANTDALVWHKNVIRSVVQTYPRLLENVLSLACDYLMWYVATHLSLVSHSARERLAHVLVSLAEGIGHKGPSGVRIEITNEQLANTANVTLFTASRTLSDFQREGAIIKTRGKVQIIHPGRLFAAEPRSRMADG
jgi:CRP/FNR family transcriptional regulator, nitrogen oxide reductase regulator